MLLPGEGPEHPGISIWVGRFTVSSIDGSEFGSLGYPPKGG
jgi:hypothetical protein